MKVVLITDSPYVSTGFGTAARNLIPYICEAGIETVQLGIYHLDRDVTQFHGVPVMPVSPKDTMGVEVMEDLLATDPDVFLIIHELIYAGVWASAARSLGFRGSIIGFVPVYGPRLSDREMISLRLLDLPIAYTRYGSRVIGDHGFECPWIHLGVDHTLFRPLSDDEREKVRCKLAWDDTFVFTYIARNRWNKQQPKLLEAARILLDRGISDFHIYLHCVPRPVSPHWIPGRGMMSQEWDLLKIREDLGVTDHVSFPDTLDHQHEGIADRDLVLRLQSADCVVHVAHGEGFGLPIVESLSCAVPVICTADGRAMQEILDDAGILVDTDTRLEDSHGNTFKDVRPEEWATAMGEVYYDLQDGELRRAHRERTFARSVSFDWEKTAMQLISHMDNFRERRSNAWRHG